MIRTEIEQAKSQIITDMPRGGKQPDLTDYLYKLEKLDKKIYHTMQMLREYKLEIHNTIAEVDNGTESEVLRLRYIELKPWEIICTEIGYGWAQMHRIHSSALSKLDLPKDDIE